MSICSFAQKPDLSLAQKFSFALAARAQFRSISMPGQGGYLSICFDDVPRTAWTTGGEILREHGVHGSYYLSGALCGTHFDGREQYRQEDARAILSAGHDIGSHLFNHVSTLGLTAGQLLADIARNDRFLEEALGPGFRATTFAYPYGEFSVSAKRLCAQRFSSCRSVMEGLNHDRADADQLAVLPIDNCFAETVDLRGLLARAAREGAWFIALAHGIDESGHPYSCSPRRLEAMIDTARAEGLTILPVGRVLQPVSPQVPN